MLWIPPSDREVGDNQLRNHSYSFHLIWRVLKKGIACNGRQTNSPWDLGHWSDLKGSLWHEGTAIWDSFIRNTSKDFSFWVICIQACCILCSCTSCTSGTLELGYAPYMRTRSSPDRVDPFLLWRYHFSLVRRGWKFEDFAKGRHHLGTHQVLQFSWYFLLNRYRAVRSCRRNQVNVCRSQKARNGEHSVSDCCACGPFLGSKKLLLYLIVTEIFSKPPPNVGYFLCEDQAPQDLFLCT